MRNVLLSFMFSLLALSAGCSREGSDPRSSEGSEPPPTVAPTVGDRPAPAAAPEAEPEPASSPPALPAVEQALREIRDKTRCNRVMGCPPAQALVRAGVASVAPAVDLLRRSSGDAPWRAELVRVLGVIGHRDALPLLRDLLDDPQWLMRAEAAVALGRMRDAEALPALESLMEGSTDADHAAEHAAAGFALVRLGRADAGKAALLGTLTPEAVGRNNWGFTALAVELAGELRLQEALPGIRAAARHQDVFLRKAAFAALASLRDRQAARTLVEALGDRIPSVRTAARAALEAITGEKRTDDEWRAWCEAGCEG